MKRKVSKRKLNDKVYWFDLGCQFKISKEAKEKLNDKQNGLVIIYLFEQYFRKKSKQKEN